MNDDVWKNEQLKIAISVRQWNGITPSLSYKIQVFIVSMKLLAVVNVAIIFTINDEWSAISYFFAQSKTALNIKA